MYPSPPNYGPMVRARAMQARFQGFGATALPGSADVYTDSAGNAITIDANGAITHFQPALGGVAAWNQTPVYIAAALGVIAGVAGYMAYTKKRHRRR